jgi:hypothetical protein
LPLKIAHYQGANFAPGKPVPFAKTLMSYLKYQDTLGLTGEIIRGRELNITIPNHDKTHLFQNQDIETQT